MTHAEVNMFVKNVIGANCCSNILLLFIRGVRQSLDSSFPRDFYIEVW